MVRWPRNEKQTYRLISRPQMWPSGLTLAMTLTLNFQGQMRNWIYLCHKWSDCHETKSKHISWILGLKCDHQIWPWPWPWPWIFKVKYEICYISTKSGPIAAKQKANILIWTLGLKCDNGFDLGHDIDIWIFKVICDLDHLVTKVRCKDLPDSDQGDFRCRRAVDSSSYVWWMGHVVLVAVTGTTAGIARLFGVYVPFSTYCCNFMCPRADSRFALNQWETVLLCNYVSHCWPQS